jgi:hypothetical protein
MFPLDIWSVIVAFLGPRDLQLLQVALHCDFYRFYRLHKGYMFIEDEKTSFDFFHHHYFQRHLYERVQHVPGIISEGFRKIRSPLLWTGITVEGDSPAGVIVASVHNRHVPNRGAMDWNVFLSIVMQAKSGSIGRHLVEEERELAVALVQGNYKDELKMLLRDMVPQTAEMVCCLLFFGIDPPDNLDPALYTQEVCDYWFMKTDLSQPWLVNHLPADISIDVMLKSNPLRFFAFATAKTIKKYGLIENRVEWTKEIDAFFPAMLKNRRKCGLKMKDLISLSNLHMITHGKICHLLTRNAIMLRSKMYRPSMEVLKEVAKHKDAFFNHYIDRVPFLTTEMVNELRDISWPSKRTERPKSLNPLFSNRAKVSIMSREQLLDIAYSSGPVYLFSHPRHFTVWTGTIS